MKKEFAKECNGNSDIFDSYHEWYTEEGDAEIMRLREDLMVNDKLLPSEIESMNLEKLEKYLAER